MKMMCKFIDCNKCTPLVWDVDSGESCASSGGRSIMGGLFSTQFYSEPQPALKKTTLKKKVV